jgi:mono/diheme cytochrome c family protein
MTSLLYRFRVAALTAVATIPLAGSGLAEAIDFQTAVRPILEANCFTCHGTGSSLKSDLDLTRRHGLIAGGARGPAVDLDNPEDSLLLKMVSYQDTRHQMPPSGKLPDNQIAVLRAWVMRGLPMPEVVDVEREERADHGPRYKTAINEETRNWWSYREVERPEVPLLDDARLVVNPIDAFVQEQLAKEELAPALRADKRTLIRRAYFDLTGLPPTPEEVEAFAQDPSPHAWESLIDELLASPHYGEKWGRHWLDLVRYAETNGYERDNPKPYIWRYRDYVIESFNEDKPYDRFIAEQIAGDELPDAGAEGIIATGYYRLGIWDDEPADPDMGRYDTLDGIVDTTGQVFLGMTMGCARCHDHKIDPIPQKDYYKLLSFFQNTTKMHTTNIIRSILTEEEAAAYQEAVKDHRQRIRETERRIEEFEQTFLERLLEAEPKLRGNVHASDMEDMRYRFYRDTYKKLPDFDNLKHEDEGTLDHDFFDLAPRTRNEAFGFVFEARINVPEPGEYTFYLDSDDGARLLVDGAKVVNYDGLHGLGDEKSVTVALEAGSHPIRLEYFQESSELGLRVAWSGPGFDRRLLSNAGSKDLDLPALMAARKAEFLDESELKRLAFLEDKLKRQKEYTVPGNEVAAAIAENGPEAPATHVLLRGSPHSPGDEVEPGFPEVLGFKAPEIPAAPKDAETSGRRKHLAQWLTREDNPLTARVMANRLWQYHFGRGIVRTPNDFGQAGEAPTHPELLDWLAAEFMDGGWRMKRMHRLIMLSYTYQMASTQNDRNYAKDPRNDHFWRYDMRRLTSEEIRDSLLAVTGTLNPKVGGPSVYPPMPEAALQTASRPDEAWGESKEEDHTRRSVYIHLKRSLVTPLLQDFDQADTDSSCPVRFVTTQPTQALNLMNSKYLYEQAEIFADRLVEDAGPNTGDRVERALELATARPAAQHEIERGVKVIEELQRDFGLSEETALDRFALLVLNLNEFMFLD